MPAANRHSVKHHSKGGASQQRFYVFNEHRLPCWPQGRHYFLRFLFLLLSRKVSNAISNCPKHISKLIIPRNTIIISYVVMITHLPSIVYRSGSCRPCCGFIDILSQIHHQLNRSSNIFSWHIQRIPMNAPILYILPYTLCLIFTFQ